MVPCSNAYRYPRDPHAAGRLVPSRPGNRRAQVISLLAVVVKGAFRAITSDQAGAHRQHQRRFADNWLAVACLWTLITFGGAQLRFPAAKLPATR